MKKRLNRTLSVLLTVIMLFTALPLSSGLFTAAAENNYFVGDIVEFGSYPQSRVTDETLCATLGGLEKTWVSYGYYTGTGEVGTMTQSDYMKYADVSYGGERYRAVTFTQYRPYHTFLISSASNSEQDSSVYSPNTVYWFKYEPLKWRVLDPATGLVMCETIIDSQPYSNMIYWVDKDSDGIRDIEESFNSAAGLYYANNYFTSSLREWLNDSFYNAAFTSAQQAEIYTTELDNSAFPGYPRYNSKPTNDKVFLLSYSEVHNTAYGFPSGGAYALRTSGSDYARAQGLGQGTYDGQDGSSWFLRSPGRSSAAACYVGYSGYADHLNVNYTSIGCRPALRFNLESIPYQVVKVAGVTLMPETLSLTVGSVAQLISTVIPLNATNKAILYSSDNSFVAWVNSNGLVTAVTPGEATITVTTLDGSVTDTCVVTVICTHSNFNWITERWPTCTAAGYRYKQCGILNCGVTLETQDIAALGHTDENADGICDRCRHDSTKDCSCNCHKTGFMGFIYKIILIFWKLFKTNKTCACGINHY